MIVEQLTRTEWMEKFKEIMGKCYYVPQFIDGELERIAQCRDPYPPYWFISNMGYLFSIADGTLKIKKPTYESYLKSRSQWTYDYRKDSKYKMVRMQVLIAEHFFPEYDRQNKDQEIHHIRKSRLFNKNEPQFCNRITNLQILDHDMHKEITAYGRRDLDKYKQTIIKKAQKDNEIVLSLPQDTLMQIAANLISRSQDSRLLLRSEDGEECKVIIPKITMPKIEQ